MTSGALNRRKAFRERVFGPLLWRGEDVEMKRVCAWCQKPMNDVPEEGAPVSHGICDRCVELALMKDKSRDTQKPAGFQLEGYKKGPVAQRPFTS
jgi:hypothetical protein